MVWPPQRQRLLSASPYKERAQRPSCFKPLRPFPQRMEPRGMIIPLVLALVDTRPAQAHIRGMARRRGVTVRGWAVWGATLAIVLLLNGIVWTLVIAW